MKNQEKSPLGHNITQLSNNQCIVPGCLAQKRNKIPPFLDSTVADFQVRYSEALRQELDIASRYETIKLTFAFHDCYIIKSRLRNVGQEIRLNWRQNLELIKLLPYMPQLLSRHGIARLLISFQYYDYEHNRNLEANGEEILKLVTLNSRGFSIPYGYGAPHWFNI